MKLKTSKYSNNLKKIYLTFSPMKKIPAFNQTNILSKTNKKL
jgi:hypothetical protein